MHEVKRKDSYGWVMLAGAPCWFPMAWFEPVTDEAETCLCNSDRGPRSCPEHGVRCHNPDCDKLCDGIAAFNSLKEDGKVVHWCSEVCWRESHFAEQPKVDPYEAHRLKLEADGLHECDMRVMTTAKQPGATARLHSALEGEKVRERVKAFPHPARNPR